MSNISNFRLFFVERKFLICVPIFDSRLNRGVPNYKTKVKWMSPITCMDMLANSTIKHSIRKYDWMFAYSIMKQFKVRKLNYKAFQYLENSIKTILIVWNLCKIEQRELSCFIIEFSNILSYFSKKPECFMFARISIHVIRLFHLILFYNWVTPYRENIFLIQGLKEMWHGWNRYKKFETKFIFPRIWYICYT